MSNVKAFEPKDLSCRRKYPRRSFMRQMGILLDGRYWMGKATELGEGGIGFVFGQKLEIGKLVVINFQLPDGAFISVQGEIMNASPHRDIGFIHGVEFRTLKFEARREVRAYVSARA